MMGGRRGVFLAVALYGSEACCHPGSLQVRAASSFCLLPTPGVKRVRFALEHRGLLDASPQRAAAPCCAERPSPHRTLGRAGGHRTAQAWPCAAPVSRPPALVVAVRRPFRTDGVQSVPADGMERWLGRSRGALHAQTVRVRHHEADGEGRKH